MACLSAHWMEIPKRVIAEEVVHSNIAALSGMGEFII